MTTLTLPRLHWGDATATRRALLVHGLGSSAHTMWRIGEGLAELGWSATAVDLRGHGDAPRASRYRIADLAGDLAATRPVHATVDGETTDGWDLVIAHSIGGAAAIRAAATTVDWARRLVLLDPAIVADEQVRQAVLAGQLANHGGATVEQTAADNPRWHPLDVELRVRAVKAASRFALEHAVLDNPDWDATPFVAHVGAPTLIIGADPAHGSMFAGEHAAEVLAANPRFAHVVIEGAGHNVHRDDPEAVLAHLRGWLGEH